MAEERDNSGCDIDKGWTRLVSIADTSDPPSWVRTIYLRACALHLILDDFATIIKDGREALHTTIEILVRVVKKNVRTFSQIWSDFQIGYLGPPIALL